MLFRSTHIYFLTVKKLKQQGYIKKTVAILDRQKINMGLISFSQVFLKAHTAEVLNEFEKEVAKFPEVMECYQMAGSYDFMLGRFSNRL